MNSLRVRPLELNDLERASSLSTTIMLNLWDEHLRDYYPKRALRHDLVFHSRESYARILEDSHSFCFVAELGKDLVGVVVGRVDGGVASIRWIGVHPSWRKRGIGRRLLTRAVEHCKKLGCHKVTLYTLPTIIPAMNLYLKSGFVPEAYLRKHWWGVDYVVMSKWV